ncbi:MAG: serine/threonine protein kinase, partial [Deltaproteobacteria bacterium]|nr:serine/threonine protein kinase [Deltaproteobacteria bacterium]
MSEVLGEFRVVATLGAGGSGIVYDAVRDGQRVALKVLRPELVEEPRERKQFLAEAERLRSVAHPSVVKVLAAGELPDGRPYLAMERLEGETLARMLARGPLAAPLALALFEELAAATAAIHAQGLVHRDIKPENVLVVGGRRAVLLDFGIAREVDAPRSTTTRAGNVRGTPAYMAPERFYGHPATIASDVYELAVTLYAMLAGRLPWSDVANPEARLTPAPLTDVPRELDGEIRCALSTRAERRPASAAELCERV